MATSDFDVIRKNLLKAGSLFEDPDFPASDSSIFFSRRPPVKITWLRPYEICRLQGSEPKFFADGGSRFDIVQGQLGDCWMLAAAANVSRFPTLFNRLVPKDQSFKKDWYAGIFRFCFWRYGTWIEVFVDDRLPTSEGKLVMVQSKNPAEFWGSLLEKAYAKVFGSYEAIKGGYNADSLTDFTGGLVESIDLHYPPSDLARILATATQRKSVMSASIYGDSERNPVRSNGLVTGHAYSVTGYTKIKKETDGTEEFLVRVRNPWGSEVEWNGRWSDRSTEWRTLSSDSRKALGLTKDDDGEFWMSLADFVKNYDSIEICNMTADFLRDAPKTWSISIAHSQWKPSSTAGGSVKSYNYWTNPQFHLVINDYDEDNDNLASMVVEVLQKNRRRNHLPYLPVAIYVHRVPPGVEIPLDKNHLKKYDPVASSGTSIPLRSVVARFNLPPGDYIIIAATEKEGFPGEFMLRVYSEAPHTTRSI